ncbi:hypothetical protein ASF60_14965 [Methylobacterium sp. Leaf113]|uniref:type II secretion system protein GspM n=1 Tax=Methylobacterium sp. Leaf113 TaxID=1736259 RepID=UPI0006F6DFD4|nr:type II secretion system protein GspM [Methylobacterium sp. Leaf113]KQP93243.1 hypothetical protein ASF60_14965 [Methylobacterium sp. Leaf113]
MKAGLFVGSRIGAGWRRISDLLLLLALLGGGGIAQWSFWTGIQETRAQIAEREVLNAGLKRSTERLLPEAASPDAASPRPKLYLSGETDTIAAAALQTHVLAILEANAAVIQSTRVHPSAPTERGPDASTEAEAGRRINLEVTFDARITDLQRILFQLETQSPALFVAELQIRPLRPIGARNPSEDDPVLHVVLALFGFCRN